MPDYSVFGSCLHSELEFPELKSVSDTLPKWNLTLGEPRNPASDSHPLGQYEITESISVRLYQSNSGFEVRFDDTGSFHVDRKGMEIHWIPGPDPDPEKVRADVLGPVLATAFHAAGVFCLHGSAVALGSGSIAFLAPKHHGKSTLAMAMVDRGARLITDDCLPVDLNEIATALPGMHSVRLWDDSYEHLQNHSENTITGPSGKHIVTDIPEESLHSEPSRLDAIYLIHPTRPEAGGRAVRRSLLPPETSALALVSNSKIGSLLGGAEAIVQLENATELARKVPVYSLAVPRDYALLDSVVEELMQWHENPKLDLAVTGTG